MNNREFQPLSPEERKKLQEEEGITPEFLESARRGLQTSAEEDLEQLELKAFRELPYESLPRATEVEKKERVPEKKPEEFREQLIDALVESNALLEEAISIKRVIIDQWDEKGVEFMKHPLYEIARSFVDGQNFFQQEYDKADTIQDFSRMAEIRRAANNNLRRVNQLYKTIIRDIEKGNVGNS